MQILAFTFLFFNIIPLSTSCVPDEIGALRDLKLGLEDPSQRLASWTGDDCCSWAGVGCDNRTGHVIRLDLHTRTSNYSMKLNGAFSSSTIFLEHLQYLDVSGNDFKGSSVPSFIDSFKELSYLDLSNAGFYGTVPPQIGNISGLRHIDISGNYFSDDDNGNAGLFQALSRLSSLEFLNLVYCGLSIIPQSLSSDNVFRSLSFFDLSINRFNSSIPNWVFNITSLQHLDLSGNFFQGPIPSSVGTLNSLNFLGISGIYNIVSIPSELGNLCNLKILDLSYSPLRTEFIKLERIFSGCIRNSLEYLDFPRSELSGILPEWIGEIKNLKSLQLFGNSIYGSVPDSIGRLSHLETLHIGSNLLNGTITKSLGQLSNLMSLDLSENSLHGVLSEVHFGNLTRLDFLDLSSNSLIIEIDSDWIPPFQLEYLSLGHCKIGPSFPLWLSNQNNLTYLDLSQIDISDTMPDWFWSLTSKLNYLDLSNNQIIGKLPDSLVLGDGDYVQVFLNSNKFYGGVPRVPPNVARLSLSNNSLSGQIPDSISDEKSILEFTSFSNNKLIGTIPSSICKLRKLHYLDVSSNHLSGELPNCWNRSSEYLQGLDFSNNNFTGKFPHSICLLPSLITLHLSNNELTGELHSSLKSCINLVTLDLSFNRFNGEIPTWLAESLNNLKILGLRSNLLGGNIPPQLSKLAYLQILDLARNNLSGSIPRSFGNFSTMKNAESSLAPVLTSFINFNDHMQLSINGMDLQYEGSLSLLKTIDLSDNNLSGKIPAELADLVGLQSLNLSKNHLTGRIIEDIGNLRQLRSLDLSRNELSGEIPPSLGELTFLSQLNLSYNELSGRIPSGKQLRALPYPSIYVGNRNLCGFPLPECGSGD
ncbi:leucine-rich repeat receptor protein kinase MSP1-like [Asparagus officinalis]|nr:leucine-rich repeat receptor protein kinase MSP1-like [Asparagus officinalis]